VYRNCCECQEQFLFSPCLSLEFSCNELVIQWKICRHIVGKSKSFRQTFTHNCCRCNYFV
jgi:hypothetical protein